MLLKYLGTVLPAHEGENRIVSIAWSPNNLKLAVACSDRTIYLFDENRVKKDKFSTKPIESKYGKKSYVIKGIAFSPDSTKIAVGQSDNIVYVYKIGENWGEKKVICNKFTQHSPVTCLAWLSEGLIVVGLADGKVRAALSKTHKVQTLYASDSMVLTIAVNVRGTGFVSSHADGSIIQYFISDSESSARSGRLVVHPVPAYALAWAQGHILAAGCDKKVTFYNSSGKVSKTFDYTRNNEEKELTVACCSPSGQSVAVGSWNKLRIFDWSPRRSTWEEANTRDLPNFYTVTALAWRKDGSRLVVGGLCTALEMFETVLRRTVVRGSHEVAYVGPSQLVIRSLDGKARPVIIKSQTNNEIEDVRILGRRDNHVVAKTSNTLLISDLELNLMSEIPWDNKAGNEKFFFEYPGVCLIFCSGELTIVEYGKNDILGSVRTESMNPHVVSVRINERQSLNSNLDNKRLAYLLDPRTVRVIDFVTGATISNVSHDARIDWVELSETGHRLLFRDRRTKLWLCGDQGEKFLLLNDTGFVSWVPGSDVVVAQSSQSLAVWYNVDAPNAPTLISIRGDAVDIVRENNQTSVMVEEQGNLVAYLLDEALIEFGTALHDNDFGRVLLFLEDFSDVDRSQVEAMWENVSRNAIAARELSIAARCNAALGDVACAKFLRDIVETGEEYARQTGNDPLACPDCWAKLAILNGELKTAESIYLEQNELGKALQMYQKYWHWEEALSLAQSRNWQNLSELRDKHLSWLLESGQIAKAAAVIELENPRKAIKLYLEAYRPGRAARLLLRDDELLADSALLNEVIRSLKNTDCMELAAEILEKTGDYKAAIDCYSQASSFAKALELARSYEPNLVVSLENDWGRHLAETGHFDAAINHFIEAGETLLALNAAVDAKQWKKALQIIKVVENDDDPEIQNQCEKLAEHYASVNDRSLAETLFLRSGKPRRAVELHIKAKDWLRAQQVATDHLDVSEANQLLAEYAESLELSGDLKNAEKFYIATGQYDEAISMYKKSGNRSDMIRLVAAYRPEFLAATHAHLARELETAGKPKEAEEHFLGAGDWRGAVTAYRSCNMWEDAFRVAKKASSDKAAQQVALMWARSLAPELGARLLNRLDYMTPCLLLACEAGLFDWALEISKYGTPDQKANVHYRYALTLEDEQKYAEAEREFVLADKAMEAVQMYIHIHNWDAAEEVARSLNQDALVQVYVARANEAVESQNFSAAEALLLRAHKPEIIIDHYKKAGMWSEAMRVCREYLPTQEPALRRELSQKSSQMDDSNIIEEARGWLDVGEVRTALDILILDPHASKAALVQAAEILQRNADPEIIVQVAGDLGSRLFAIGEYNLAAQIFLQADRWKDAIDALAETGDWDRARRIINELAPDLDTYLEEKYKESMIKDGHIERLAEVDVDAALEILARKGQWTQLFEKAKLQSSKITLHRYLAQRAAQLLQSDSILEAIKLYAQYGALPIPQNFNLYQHLAETLMNSEELNQDYYNLAQLRNVLLNLTKQLEPTTESFARFERLLQASHYLAVRCACRPLSSLSSLVVKCSISLLRFSDIIYADRCYYEAGLDAREANLLSEAFVFLNHFLDLADCIEEGNESIVDFEDLQVTDFPSEVPLPSTMSVTDEQREKVKEWILSVSVDRKIEQSLPVDHSGIYIGSLRSNNLPMSKAKPSQSCALTGYPIRESSVVQFDETNRVVSKEDWNKLLSAARQAGENSSLSDVLAFIREWCGALPTYTF